MPCGRTCWWPSSVAPLRSVPASSPRSWRKPCKCACSVVQRTPRSLLPRWGQHKLIHLWNQNKHISVTRQVECGELDVSQYTSFYIRTCSPDLTHQCMISQYTLFNIWPTCAELELLLYITILQVNTWYDVIIGGDTPGDAHLIRDMGEVDTDGAFWVMPHYTSGGTGSVLDRGILETGIPVIWITWLIPKIYNEDYIRVACLERKTPTYARTFLSAFFLGGSTR